MRETAGIGFSSRGRADVSSCREIAIEKWPIPVEAPPCFPHFNDMKSAAETQIPAEFSPELAMENDGKWWKMMENHDQSTIKLKPQIKDK